MSRRRMRPSIAGIRGLNPDAAGEPVILLITSSTRRLL
jgi:hypothetical protein